MLYQVGCDRCGYTQKVSDKLCFYQLHDGGRIFINTRWAWCLACASLVEAEFVPMLEETITAYQESLPGYLEEGESWLKERVLEEGLRTIEWRKLRQAPAHCLACGGTDFVGFVVNRTTGNYDSIEHPHCGGRLSLRGIGFAIPAAEYIYSPEGKFIEERGR